MKNKSNKTPLTSNWYKISWKHVNRYIEDLQCKIVVAYRNRDIKEMYRLQDLLMRSWAGRAMAVRKTTTASGGNTAGIDKVILNTAQEKWDAIGELHRNLENPNNYKAKPVKRVMIPKPNQPGKERPLGIPVQIDRAMQNLVLMSYDPISEETSDLYSYGFRKFRSPGGAMARIRHILDKSTAPRFIWDADIKGCFDNISFEAVRKALDGKLSPAGILLVEKWLNSGIIYKGKTTWPTKGIPQGGVISPTLMNAVLNGLEGVIRGENVSWEKKVSQKEFNKLKNCWVVRFADDFIITSPTLEKLEEIILKVKEFLKSRGLEISSEKSKIIDLWESGFYFLGWEVMTPLRNWKLNKLGGHARTYVARPMKASVERIKEKIQKAFDIKHSMKQIVKILNPIIRGWCNYYRTSYHSQRAFQFLTGYLLLKFYNWGRRKHSSRGTKWLRTRYIFRTRTRKWNIGDNEKALIVVPDQSSHWQLRAMKSDLNPYTDQEYFVSRNIHLTAERLRKTVYIRYNFRCAVCNGPLAGEESVEIHHIKPVVEGGKTLITNLAPVHTTCHKSVTYAGAKLIERKEKSN